MTMIDEKALEAAMEALRAAGMKREGSSKLTLGTVLATDLARAAITAYEAAKPVAEPVAWVQREVLDELGRHKDATATVASGLLKKPFGNPVALYALSAPASKDGG